MTENIEFVDIFDSEMKPCSPFKIPKSGAHKNGCWHKTIHCWIVKNNGKILFQLRSPRCSYGDLFDITSAGHISAGEEPKDGVRELKEELNLDVGIDDLTFIGIYKQMAKRKEDNYDNREFSYTYLYKCDKNLEEYTLQEAEVKGLFEMDIREGLKLFSKEIKEISVKGVILTPSGLIKETRTITLDNMAMSHERCVISRYYLRVLIMAERFINNEKYLAI